MLSATSWAAKFSAESHGDITVHQKARRNVCPVQHDSVGRGFRQSCDGSCKKLTPQTSSRKLTSGNPTRLVRPWMMLWSWPAVGLQPLLLLLPAPPVSDASSEIDCCNDKWECCWSLRLVGPLFPKGLGHMPSEAREGHKHFSGNIRKVSAHALVKLRMEK